MKTMKSFFFLIAIISGVAAKATNYYISNLTGNDINAGTSAAAPWKTLTKLRSFDRLVAGDSVLFKRGEIFYGSIIVDRSGSSRSNITFSAYGSGSNPVVTGFTPVNTWINLGADIWESGSSVSTLSTLNIVTVNAVNTRMGRYPNTGFLAYQAHEGTESIISAALNSSVTNWAGAEIVMRPTRWALQRELIVNQSGKKITYSGSTETPTNGYGFFIQNDSRTLDTTNEWYYNPATKKIRIYSTVRPANVQVSTIDELVLNSSANYITFDHIDFEGANSYLFEVRNSKNVTIQNCSFLFAGKTAIYNNAKISANEIMAIDNNVFSDNNENAMNFASYSSKILIRHNTINNTGMIPGAGTNTQYSGDAIIMAGVGSIAEYNTVSNSGHIGIETRQNDNITVRYNYITDFGMTRYDAGGVYSWNQDSTRTPTGRFFDHNIIVNSKQIREGIGTDDLSLFGIYLDGSSKNTFITNNTVANSYTTGILILNSGSVTITGNTCYNNGNQQLELEHAFKGGQPINGMVIKHNIFFSKTNTQLAFYFRDDDTLHFNTFGIADSNFYARPVDDKLTIKTAVVYKGTNRTLAGWQRYSGSDVHSLSSPEIITNVNDSRFEYNATSSAKTISLNADYIDVKGMVYTGSVTLAPYTSIVLIKKH